MNTTRKPSLQLIRAGLARVDLVQHQDSQGEGEEEEALTEGKEAAARGIRDLETV
jgi:hypothetical protein